MPLSLGRRHLRRKHRFSLGSPVQLGVWLQPLQARQPRLLLLVLTALCSPSPSLPPRLLLRWQQLPQAWAALGQARCLAAVRQPVLWCSRRQSTRLLAAVQHLPQLRPCSSHSGCPALCQRRPRGQRVTAAKLMQSLQLMMLSLAQKTLMRN